jgi:hypothetical protein
VPISASSPAISAFRLQLERNLQLCEVRTALHSQADALLADNLDHQRLETAPGVWPIIALVIPEVLGAGSGEEPVRCLQVA